MHWQWSRRIWAGYTNGTKINRQICSWISFFDFILFFLFGFFLVKSEINSFLICVCHYCFSYLYSTTLWVYCFSNNTNTNNNNNIKEHKQTARRLRFIEFACCFRRNLSCLQTTKAHIMLKFEKEITKYI